VIDVVQTR